LTWRKKKILVGIAFSGARHERSPSQEGIQIKREQKPETKTTDFANKKRAKQKKKAEKGGQSSTQTRCKHLKTG